MKFTVKFYNVLFLLDWWNVDTLALKAGASWRNGSSPLLSTNIKIHNWRNWSAQDAYIVKVTGSNPVLWTIIHLIPIIVKIISILEMRE